METDFNEKLKIYITQICFITNMSTGDDQACKICQFFLKNKDEWQQRYEPYIGSLNSRDIICNKQCNSILGRIKLKVDNGLFFTTISRIRDDPDLFFF